GVGDPREKTDGRIRQALVDGLTEVSSYPAAAGLPALREAIAAWYERRFGLRLDPQREIVPTLGSKEAIFLMALVVGQPLRESNSFLPDLASLTPEVLDHVALFWVNYPNNPTAAVAPLELYEELSALAVRHEFVLASDEAYGEIYFGRPPATALQVSDRRNVAVLNTLSKRSSMTGYRSGAIIAGAELCDALRAFRPSVGVAPQEFVQRASIWAWSDEQHVADMRGSYGAKRKVLLEALERKRLRVAGCEATFYLWVEVPA